MRKRKNHLRHESYTSDLLVKMGDYLLDMCEGLEYPRIAGYHGVGAVQEFKYAKDLSEKRHAIYKLKQSRYIEVNKLADKMTAKMTEAGLREYLYQKIMRANLLPDGKFCLVIFDIPEDRRDVRKELRQLLSCAAFMPIQKSVWASPVDASKELSKFFKFNGRRKWVRIFTADEAK